MYQVTLSQILKTLIFKRDMNVTSLARFSGVPQQTLQRIVAGFSPHPHRSTLEQLAKYLNLSVEQLTGHLPIPELNAFFISQKFLNLRAVPLIPKDKADSWQQIKSDEFENVIVDIKCSDFTYAVRWSNFSPTAIYGKNSLLIIDPEKSLSDSCYALVKTFNENTVFLCLISRENNEWYMNSLNPVVDKFNIKKLSKKEKICGRLVQMRHNFI